MNSKKNPHSKPSMGNVVLGVLMVAVVFITLAHTVSFTQQMITQRVGLPTDWTHQHVIFSNPGTFQEANAGGNFLEWYRTINDPRYRMQQIRRNLAMRQGGTTTAQEEVSAGAIGLLRPEFVPDELKPRPLPWRPTPTPSGSQLRKDWSMLPAKSAVGIAGVYPAKYNFYPGAATCTDYVVFPTGVAGSATAPSIVAYNNLYSGCPTTGNNPVPNVQWAVDLNSGTVNTSPVLSWDGTQVAFVATISGVANLVVMNLEPLGTVSTVPVTAIGSSTSNVNTTTYPSCTLCATYAALSGSPTDTVSSPFYDYTNNVLYVGDASGVLHKFTNVFYNYDGGTNTTKPTETTGGGTSSGWPQTITSGDPLSSPVYDSGTSQDVFVGIDANNLGIARIPSTGGSSNVVKSGQLDKAGTAWAFSIIVDSTSEKVYVFTAHGVGTSPDTAGVFQLAAAFASGNAGTQAYVGTGGAGSLDNYIMYAGAFDNAYYTSSGSLRSGSLYVCTPVENSSAGGTNIYPTLFRIAISGGALSTVSTGPVLSDTSHNCSPVTEIYNGTNDFIFMSQPSTNITASPISCASGTGCIMSWDMASTPTLSSSAPTTTAKTLAAAGTGGIIIDNTAGTPTGTSQVYFSVLGSQSCTRTVTGNTNGTTSITATAGIFTAGDIGATITGTDVNTTIASVQSSTTATLTAAASGTVSSDTFTITDTGGCAIQASQATLSH